MNSSIISQVARPTISAISKKTTVRTFFATPVKSFYSEEAKAHHQVAPLTDATIYAPQGHTNTSASTTVASEAAPETVIFSPTVNHVFDD